MQATFAFVGVDLFVVSAVEESTSDANRNTADGDQLTRDRHHRTLPGKFIPLTVFVLYTCAAIVSAFPVKGDDELYDYLQSNYFCDRDWISSAIVVIAQVRLDAQNNVQKTFGSAFITIFLMYAAFSAAFTTLYAASRTLFGLNRHLNHPGKVNDDVQSCTIDFISCFTLLRLTIVVASP